MFFILSKTAAFLLLPTNLLILLGLAGVVLLARRFKRAGLRMTAAALILLALAGVLPVGSLLTHMLESRFPPWDPARGPPDGIVVLGGGISPELSRAHGEPIVTADAARIVALAKLARAYPNARIVYAGGNPNLVADGLDEGKFLYRLLDSFGIARERVTVEPRSRNTIENAVFTKDLMKPKADERWLLVTSAQHMPRAVGCFRQVGFPVEAYPVGGRTRDRFQPLPGYDLSLGLAKLDFVTHEWIGLMAYWLTGKTSELLPGPAPVR
jgi:uncharacterized SAM-binding protein YcdF (DUF218 family)